MILFKEQVVKDLCLAREWNTDGDNEISRMEAANVRVISATDGFQNNTAITSFDELRFFTAVSQLNPNAFQGCVNMTSIMLPPSLNVIKEECFKGCTALTEITLLGAVNNIGSDAFAGCTITVTMEGTIPPKVVKEATNPSFPAGTTIKVPQGALDEYKNEWATGITNNGWNIIGY